MKPHSLAAILLVASASPGSAQQGPPQVDHFMVGISVGNIDQMTDWYRDILGFKLARDVPMGSNGKVRFLESGTERIELVSVAGSKPAAHRGMPPAHAAMHGFVQLTMEVPDLDAAKAWLIAKHVEIGLDITPIPHLGIRILFVRDPEGNLVELVQKLPD